MFPIKSIEIQIERIRVCRAIRGSGQWSDKLQMLLIYQGKIV